MKALELGPLKQGINRLRDKGGASVKFLYDLLNGYIDVTGTARSRSGTSKVVTLPTGSVGLSWFNGEYQVFSTTPIDTSTLAVPVKVNVLHHPDPTFTGTIARIHFAKPFLGVMYVVAEFSNGDVYHYWLQQGKSWQASHNYFPEEKPDELPVTPVTANGFFYEPSPADSPKPWKPLIERSVGDVITPSADFIANNPAAADYKMVVSEIIGSVPASGDSEPQWALTVGGVTYEYYQPGQTNPGDGTTAPSSSPSTPSGGGSDSGKGPGGTKYQF